MHDWEGADPSTAYALPSALCRARRSAFAAASTLKDSAWYNSLRSTVTKGESSPWGVGWGA